MRITRETLKQQAIKVGKKAGLAGAALTAFVNQAMAAVPAEVTTALADAKTDGTTIATTVFVAIVVLFAFMLMRKALR